MTEPPHTRRTLVSVRDRMIHGVDRAVYRILVWIRSWPRRPDDGSIADAIRADSQQAVRVLTGWGVVTIVWMIALDFGTGASETNVRSGPPIT